MVITVEYFFSGRVSSLQPSAIREILKAASDPGVISFSAGNPAAESFPVEEIRRLSAEILQDSASAALQYGITEGYTPLRDALKARQKAKFGIGRGFDDLIVVSGAQQGIDLAARVLLNEGDTVICENPSFIGALNAFRATGARLCGVPLERDGMELAALEHALKTEKNVRFIYIIPTFQNPAGLTTSLAKRRAIYALAKKYGVLILEDSPYVDLRFAGEDVPCIKSFDEDGIVIYCGSFSKILSAGIRVGYVQAPRDVIQKMVVVKQVSDVHTNLFFQMLAYRYITQCDMEKHIENIRALYRRKSGLMQECLAKDVPALRFSPAEGGLFLWCGLPEGTDPADYCKRAAAQGVALVPGEAFAANAANAANAADKLRAVRLNYSTPSDEQIVEGVRRLAAV